MKKSKKLMCLFVCFAFLFARSSFAGIPAFDPMSYIPDIKQFKELAEDLRNTKEQLNQIRQDLRAMGDSIRSVASYSQAILHLAKRGLRAVEDTVGLINDTLGTDIKVGEGLNNIIDEADNIHKNVVERTVNDIGSVLDGDKLDDFIDDKKEQVHSAVESKKEEIIDAIEKPIKDAHQDIVDSWENMKDDVRDGVNDATKGVRTEIGKQVDNIKGFDSDVRGGIEEANEAKEKIDNAKDKIDNKKKRIAKDLFDIEEEEEEEEVSNKEAIDGIKYYFKSVQDENKKIAARLNDVLDMHINKLNKSAEYAEKSLTELELGVSQSPNFSPKEKEEFSNRIIDIKAAHRKVYDWNIVLAEKTKEKYNKEFKNKILDGMSNYEKITIAYINGDATKTDVEKVGIKVKQDAKSMRVATDAKVMKQIKKEALKLRRDLMALSDDIKKIEKNTKS